jgi:hypothetical protein
VSSEWAGGVEIGAELSCRSPLQEREPGALPISQVRHRKEAVALPSRTWLESGEPAGDAPVHWIGGQPVGETFLRRVNRTTARTIVEVDVGDLPPVVAREVMVWVENQMYRMPFHVKLGVAMVATIITMHALVRTGRPPWRLSAPARARLLRAWEASKVPPVAQYVRLERSLVLYAAYEQVSPTS